MSLALRILAVVAAQAFDWRMREREQRAWSQKAAAAKEYLLAARAELRANMFAHSAKCLEDICNEFRDRS